jgi:protease-4
MSSDPFQTHDPSGSRPPAYPYPPRSSNPLLGCGFALSFLFNILASVLILLLCIGLAARNVGDDDFSSMPIPEKFHSGTKSSNDKIAVLSLDGVIMEGLLEFVHRQIEKALKDKAVKAVVFRINSPGGSITASDDLYRKLVELRDGNAEKDAPPRPLVISMGAMAASGGYYVAMPGQSILAEQSTMTGSIGVYAAFYDIKEMGEKYGFGMRTIKQGDIKDSGSPFKDMTNKERQVWQDLVDTAYLQFLGVVETGRPQLKGKLLEMIQLKAVDAGRVRGPDQAYERYRADGGIWTADKAKELGLIDQIGTLDDAVAEAKKLAGLTTYRAVRYERRKTLADILFGVRAPSAPGAFLDPGRLKAGLLPRVWYLSPGCDLAGLLAAVEAEGGQ